MGRKYITEKEPVTIRFKELAGGNRSVYLDIYHDGKRKYEFLKLYLLPEVGRNKAEARRKNAETMQVVNVIKARRILDIKNEVAGLPKINSKKKLMDLVDEYYEHKVRTSKASENKGGYVNCLRKQLILYKAQDVLLKDVDKDFCLGFINHLRYIKGKRHTTLHQNTRAEYWRTLSSVLNRAEREGLIPRNPFKLINPEDKPSVVESERVYLSLEEIKTLANTECKKPLVKMAFMFSCFCGLRISDIRTLRWSDIEVTEDAEGNTQYRLSIRMEKTKRYVTYNLSREALRWLPERGESELVFDKLAKKVCMLYTIKDWVKSAGITKNVTFHSARHTFATMMLTLGADIYTTSKLLGHTKISTTEIYAKIIDKKKDEAIGLIDNYFERGQEK